MKSAVLVLDVQTKMLTDQPRPFEADEVVKRINCVTARARSCGAPVFFVQTGSTWLPELLQ